MNSEAMRATLRVTKALADLQRVRVLMMLRRGELCVCQIIGVLELAPSTVSKHLSILDVAGLIRSRKVGRWMYYRLPEGKDRGFIRPVLKWLDGTLKTDTVVVKDEKKLNAVLACAPETLCRRRKGVY